MKSAFQIAFVDLDDTLLGPEKTISTENLLALARLRAAGLQIIVASGRHHQNIAAFREIGKLGWLLSSHGSIVRHRRTNELLLEDTLAPDRVAEICEDGRARGMTLIAYHREGAFIERRSPWANLYERLSGWSPTTIDFDKLPSTGFQKILWSNDPVEIAAMIPTIQGNYRERAQVVGTNPELMEFLALTANKAIGAHALLARLGLPSSSAMAFGDGNNDVELLRWVGFSVAMDHGRKSAHEAADRVTPAGPPESAFARAVDIALRA